jgi:hypothetical protein
MGSIIDRALDIINDHLKDQTSSFQVSPPLAAAKAMARGGEVLQDEYPTHYLPEVGRQVMADGGNPVESGLNVARSIPTEGATIPGPIAPRPPVSPFEGRVGSSKLAETFAKENAPGVIVSPRPGKGSGPRVLPERGVPYEQPEYEGYGAHGETPTSDIEFSPSTPDIAGTALPPPVQHPLQNEPRLQKVTENTQRIIKTPGFRKLVEDHVGLKGPLQVTPTHGTWLGEAEPSFILSHPDMQQEHAEKLAHLLGFGFQQDAVVRSDHNPSMTDGTLAALIGHGKKLTAKDIDGLTDAAKKEGLDYTITKDGKAAKFLHFGSDEEYPDFLDKVGRIADSNRFKERYNARTQGSLINAQDYFSGIFGKDRGSEGVQDGTARSPDLFGRIVDHVLAPYAKAVAGEGYRLSPERLAETFGLTQDEQDKVRSSLYPNAKGDRTTVPLMTGEETLDVRPTGARGNDTVNDVLYALQNRAAEKGQIDPGDFSDRARKLIASDIADEVKYHVDNSDKSAVGWYDEALKKAKNIYHQVFPELKTDKNKEMLFDAILGITSQGNDVHSNSVFAARMYDKLRNEGKSIPEAVKDLSGGFGAQTKAIEGNLMKLHHLLDQNGYDRMRDLFNQKKTVSEWNKILREDPTLRVPGQEKLTMKGAGDQKIIGWMVFGPKIGSFINNLHGDYSTLTADLWFSRTWNRLLGHNFIHAPLAEQKQYQDFKDAIKAEFLHHNGLPHEQYAGKTTEGQYQRDASGNVKPWTFGNDMQDMSHDDFQNLVNNPEKMQELAANLYEQYKGGGFKDKSDARRRAKNWMENRDLPVAAPRGDKEREFQQNTVEEAQKLLKKKHGLDISIADIQAALWFHEKELFSKLGVAPERAQPADYADAAKNAMELINKGELYRVKSREKKPAKAYGGAINPIELRYDDLDDTARRLILWSYAAAPIVRPLSRAEGGAVDDPVNKALDIVGAKSSPTSAVDTARNLTPMGFYSAAAEAASKIPQRAPIDQIINKITGQANVKKEELANANLKDTFAGQRSVDPKEVARHLQENVPQINETVYGGKPPVEYEPKALLERPKGFNYADDVYEIGQPNKPPHHIVLHDGNYSVHDSTGAFLDEADSLAGASRIANQSIGRINPTNYDEYTIPGGENYREVVMTLPGKDGYKSNHWRGVDNPLAHLRMSDRDNGKTLHIEELQSDWGQEGRKKGFGELSAEDQKNLSDARSQHSSIMEKLENATPDEYNDLSQRRRQLEETVRNLNDKIKGSVPHAPYVTDTNQWIDLGLKRALMEAAKGGYDRLVWTPGEKQADRYNLRHKISVINWNPDTNILMAHNLNGDQVIRRVTPKKELSDVIGKDLAEKLVKSGPYKAGNSYLHSIAGGDLETGGEGMKAFYDKLLPQRLNKLVAQYDPEAKAKLFGHDLKGGPNKGFVSGDEIMKSLPETQNMSDAEKSDWWRDLSNDKRDKLFEQFRKPQTIKAHTIEITPKLRAAILKGLPAFKSGGDVGESPIIDHAFKVLSKLPR